MNVEAFCRRVTDAAAQPPLVRHGRLARVHEEIKAEYLAALRSISPDRAAQQVAIGSEKRTVAQVVGHIAEWERFLLLAAGDILAGLGHPRMVTSLEGYVEPDGGKPAFATIDAFNDYQANKYASWRWEEIRRLALDTATALYTLFTHPALLNAERLEGTKPFRKRLPDGTVIHDIAMGWNVWITCLEHEGVEHALDLGMSV